QKSIKDKASSHASYRHVLCARAQRQGGGRTPIQVSATCQFSVGMAAQAACGSGLARDAGDA
ncbi:hypothetical protein ACI2KE_10195, partial [Pseudomonas monteilii]|uniref:hypothetical protein n=1 Tax=Pseudomonas alabamensis TaxID=3064349 RepID=UPI001C9312A0